MSEYYIWMTEQINNSQWFDASQYTQLLEYLDGEPFYYILEMDKNRLMDGIDLRRRCPDYDEDRSPDECSVLEMMVALAIRAEEYLTDNPEYGSRVSWWFSEMIRSMGLDDMTDELFTPETVRASVTRMVNRHYYPNGRGGLFYIPNYDGDLTKVEIWYQMNYWYMSLRR